VVRVRLGAHARVNCHCIITRAVSLRTIVRGFYTQVGDFITTLIVGMSRHQVSLLILVRPEKIYVAANEANGHMYNRQRIDVLTDFTTQKHALRSARQVSPPVSGQYGRGAHVLLH
jgi:hypothetical protein